MNGSPIPITGKSFSYAQVKNLIQYIMRSVFYGARQTEQQVSNLESNNIPWKSYL